MKDGENKVVVMDFPGLNVGASQNKGLDIEFLKHINCCHLLLHIVALDVKDTYKTYKIINKELKKYN